MSQRTHYFKQAKLDKFYEFSRIMLVWGYVGELLINWTCSLYFWGFIIYLIRRAWAWCTHDPLPMSVEALLPLIGNIDASPHNSWRMDVDVNIATNRSREDMNVKKVVEAESKSDNESEIEIDNESESESEESESDKDSE